MLGSNYASLDWPKCGEIDILEHANWNQKNPPKKIIHIHGVNDLVFPLE